MSTTPWSLFWHKGHSTTFGDYFRQGYEGAIADWWQSILEPLPGGAVVLEAGCGNCSLLPAMLDAGMTGKYIGVDLAIVTLSNVARDKLTGGKIDVSIHAETPAEHIPEANDSVDLFTSVFGMEYTDLNSSLAEAHRVSKPDGRLAMLLHHDDSVVTGMSRRAVSEYDDGDIEATIEALQTISGERDKVSSPAALKTNITAENARKRINGLAEKYLSDTDPDTANAVMFEFMNHALGFFKLMNQGAQPRRQFIDALAEEHRASHERFRQMVSVALDRPAIESLATKVKQAGWREPGFEVIHTNEDILAWELCARKQ